MRICIIGDPQDLSAVYLSILAKRRDIEVVELHENTLGIDWFFRLNDLHVTEGHIEIGDESYQLSEFCGAFVRFNPEPTLPIGFDLPSKDKSVFIAERRTALEFFINYLPFMVANRPCFCRSNASKPYQMRILTKAGFDVPIWILTNKERTAKEFAIKCNDGVVFKSCSGLRSRVSMLNEEVLWRLKEGTSPIIVQEYIKGKDVRVHVVNHRIFATEVISNGVDYRFDNQTIDFRPISVPNPIKELCREIADKEGHIIAGLDFRVTENGRWWCLEMNPAPTFLPYEIITGQPIGNALIDAFVKL